MLLALPHTIGDVIWRKILAHHPLGKLVHSGIVGILTRFVIEGGQGPVGVGKPLHADGRFQLAHTVDGRGQVDRLILNMWTSAWAPRGRTHGPPPPGAGEPISVGRVFAEHVMTRLFAPPAERKVLALPGAELPSTRYEWRDLPAVLSLPPGAQALDAELSPDPVEVVFGLTHTDSNQHVNSLVYPRLFQESMLRRLAAHGRSTMLLARRLEIAYRKPCFAGERVRFKLQSYALGDRVGAVGVLVPDGQPDTKPYCAVHMLLAP